MVLVHGRSNVVATAGRPLREPVIAIGIFDGVHRGHQALLERARAEARGGEVVALTFDPHPARLLAPALAPPLIVSLDRRAELLGTAGADVVVVEPFTRALADTEDDAFAREILHRDLQARHVVVGYDFSFGRGRRGDVTRLEAFGRDLGFGVSVVRRVSVHGLTCSSTKIREFVLEGRVEGAEVLLGRPFEITGAVVPGHRRGRDLGFPTANIRPEAELLPCPGIYAGRAVVLDGDGQRAIAAISIGTNPTFGMGGGITVEAHLLDFAAELYGRRMRLELRERLRDEQRFESVEALVTQMRRDVERTREVMS